MNDSFVQRHKLGVFYAIAVAIPVGVIVAYYLLLTLGVPIYRVQTEMVPFLAEQATYGSIVSTIRFALERHWGAWLILVYAFAPTFAAIIVSLWSGGRRGLWDWLDRFRPWRAGVAPRQALAVYGGIVAVYLVVAGLFLALGAVTGEYGEFEEFTAGLIGSPVTTVFILLLALFLDEGGTGEEPGWRGFALPLLLETMSPLKATIVLGVLWAAWHLPRDFLMLMNPETDTIGWVVFEVNFLIICVASSVILTYVVVKTGGSIWPAIFVHGGGGVWTKATGGPPWNFLSEVFPDWLKVVFIPDAKYFILCFIAIVIAVATKGQLGRQGGAETSEA
jgi:membrane protease YdiL (CAAX protease family)